MLKSKVENMPLVATKKKKNVNYAFKIEHSIKYISATAIVQSL
jgi:hypothetical protein